MSGNNSILTEKLNYDFYHEKGSNLKKIIFILCICVVLFCGLLFFKNADSQSGLHSTAKNRSFSERIMNGISTNKFWCDNTSQNTNVQASNASQNTSVTKANNSNNDEENTYYSRSLNTLLKSVETYFFNTAGELFQNLSNE